MATTTPKRSLKGSSSSKASKTSKTSIMVKKTTNSRKYLCPYCDTEKKEKEFYNSTDPKILTGITTMCRQCATDIARRKDPQGNYHEETKKSVQEALEYLDKPYIEDVWNAAYYEVNNNPLKKTNIWSSYIRLISNKAYAHMRWRDGDLFNENVYISRSNKPLSDADEAKNKEIFDNAEINKKDVIRMISYDPFERYPDPEDLPLLYANMVNFLDEDTINDGMKLNASIQIVKSFAQTEKINTAIDTYTADTMSVVQNAGVIKNLSETVNKLINTANALAKDNGISVNFNNNKSKGANTLTGKMKKLREIGFRDAAVNAFDIGSCEGMKQVAEISEAARHKQIGYDENIASEIKDIKVELVEKAIKERDEALERCRILLVENRDLKDFLRSKKLVNEKMEVIE